jgi:hypothetical protein
MMAAIASWFALLDGGTVSNGLVGGTASAITLTCSPTVDARAAGQRYAFKLGSAITGATTLAVDGLASGAIQWNQAAIVANDFAANDYIVVIDDGTNYQLVTPPKLSAYAQITNLTADGTGATGDKIPTYDVSASGPKYILISTLQTLLAASQAQMETGTSAAVNVTPSSFVFHDGSSKAWIAFDGTGTPTATDQFNFASGSSGITDNGAGDYTLTFTTAFSAAANYAMGGMANQAVAANMSSNYVQVRGSDASAVLTTSVRINVGNTGTGTPGDTEYVGVHFHGDR